MTQPEHPAIRIDITEDATAGVAIRIHHNGRFPDVLAEFPKDVLRRARPWLWNSYERRVLAKARMMSAQSYRLVRATLIAERARTVISKAQARSGANRPGWLQRRKIARNRKLAGRATVAKLLPHYRNQLALTFQKRKAVHFKEPAPQTPERSGPPLIERQPRRAALTCPTTALAGPHAAIEPMSLTERLMRITGSPVAVPTQDYERERSRLRQR